MMAAPNSIPKVFRKFPKSEAVAAPILSLPEEIVKGVIKGIGEALFGRPRQDEEELRKSKEDRDRLEKALGDAQAERKKDEERRKAEKEQMKQKLRDTEAKAQKDVRDAEKKLLAKQREEHLRLTRMYPRQPWQKSAPFLGNVNVCFVGESGNGKSTLLNAMFHGRAGVSHGGDGTRMPTPHVQTKQYGQAGNKRNLVVWDLPGLGTAMIPARTYLKEYGLKYFAFAVVVFGEPRVKENTLTVIQALRDAEIPYLVVHTKFDQVIQSVCMENGGQHNFNLGQCYEETKRQDLADLGRGVDPNSYHLTSTNTVMCAPEHLAHFQAGIGKLRQGIDGMVEAAVASGRPWYERDGSKQEESSK